MRRFLSVLVITGFVGAACSDAGSDPTVGPPEVISIDQLNAAVRPAAQALLDAPAIQATSIWFDPDGVHVRTDYLDHRDDGTYLLLGQSIGSPDDEVDEIVWVQIAESRFCASAGPDMYCDIADPETNELWTQVPTTDLGPDQLPVAVDLATMASKGATLEGFGAGQIKTTLQPDLDGVIVWTVETPLDDGSFSRVWRIDPDGVLLSYTVGADSGTALGLYSRSQFDFVIPVNPAPIPSPDVGTALDLDMLGLPSDLPLLEQ